jgi:hypothetical protein
LSPSPSASPIAGGTAADLAGALAWPAAFIIVSLIVLFYHPVRAWLTEIIRRVTKISAFGVSLELTRESARKLRDATNSTFGDVRSQIASELDRLVRANGVEQKLGRLVERTIKPALSQNDRPFANIRCTIYVEDFLYTETLYQLIDYYPSGSGRGRPISIRFGIVGKTWRLEEDDIEPDLKTDPPTLIREWGMTLRETSRAAQHRPSFAAVLLKNDEQDLVGLLYMDSSDANAFPARDTEEARQFIDSIHGSAKTLGLLNSIIAVNASMRTRSPLIPIYPSKSAE